MNKHFYALLLALVAGVVSPAGARHFVQVESSYLGGGWFQYRMTSLADPFWSDVRISSVAVGKFTNRTAYGSAPANWLGDTTNTANRASWILTSTVPQTRPYERIFLAHSSETTFKIVTNGGVFVAYAAVVQTALQNASLGNFSGFRNNVPCLVPCPPGEADSSPPVLTSVFDVIPDMKIIGETVADNALNNVSFSWSWDSTVRVEGSFDLQNWTTAGYAWGHAPWASAVFSPPLSTNGHYFRLVLLATKQLPFPGN